MTSDQQMRLYQAANKRRQASAAAGHRTRSLATLLASVAIGLMGDASAFARIPSPQSGFGVCQREGEKLVGQKPVRVGGKVRAPKKLHNVFPKYPEFPLGTTGRGNWAGEALIDTKGNVVRVWAVREVEITLPLPTFNAAIVEAIRQWRFEPFRVNKEAVPGCLTVTVSINWS